MNVQGFKNAVDTLRLYHRINNSDFNLSDSDNKTNLIDKLYVDLLPNYGLYGQMISNNTTFLIGRRGTGKSTIFAYAQSQIHQTKENLSVYINAKSVHELSKVENLGIDFNDLNGTLSSTDLRRLLLIRNFLKVFRKSLKDELSRESNGFIEKVNNYFRDKRLQKTLENLDNIVENPELINISKAINQNTVTNETRESIAEIKAALQNIDAKINNKNIESQEISTSNILARYFNLKEVVSSIEEILHICNRSKLYIFIDDFSELEKIDMASFVDVIISPLYHLGKENVNLKIAAYPNRTYFGDLDSGKYDLINIDMFNIYRKDNISSTEKAATTYTQRIIENRINHYCNTSVEEFFDTKSLSIAEYYKLLFHSSMNIVRVLGHILYNCWLSNISQGKKINRSAIELASEKYYLDHTASYFSKNKHSKGVFDDKVDIHVQENLLTSLVQHAQENKYELKNLDNSYFSDLLVVPTSHFLTQPDLDNMLASLEFNGFIHKVNELAAKGRDQKSVKNNTNYLYAFDYGLCVYEKILYGKPEIKDSKFYQQRAFDYTSFILENLKESKQIVCKNCNAKYSIDDLDIFERFKMKCMSCEDGRCQVKYSEELLRLVELEIEHAIWTKDEIEILQAIHLFNINNPSTKITASMIAEEIDRTHQFVAWRCKELATDGFMYRKDGNPYTYEIPSETVVKLKDMGIIDKANTNL
ncbi:zinc-ribbon domain-containing protein [Alkalihalobacillus sp. TS-13]|uniref:zinc-ribbon domain-containing protein n=1 Tax=Alkalihalobacillus sp. TS-13 TaxID=2842455 RepID=UPI001C879F14|nr:zinc-ribbon domain-containing protein [Alkalihalobacillus sp. TS-13]